MNSTTITKKLIIVLSVAVVLAAPSNALAWGTATHVYFAKQLGHRFGYANVQEMYGAALPDFPALMFGSPYQPYLYNLTHYEFMKFVNLAPLGYKKAMAFGFASHNEAWGADLTAHKSARLDPGKGYVTERAKGLKDLLKPQVQAFLTANGISLPNESVEELSLTLADTCVEGAVDLLVSQNEHRMVGLEMVLASDWRAWFAPALLTSAYASDLAKHAGITYWRAAWIITSAEWQSRNHLRLYGALLTQDNRLDLLAEQIAQLAETVLAQQYHVTVDVPGSMMKSCLTQAIVLVQGDYAAEVAATLEYLDNELRSRGIESSVIP